MTTYCGYIALVGKANVGKSTLLNRILGQKLSITSKRAQTTRYQILGIQTQDPYQSIYVDTPGIHHEKKKIINQLMNKTAKAVLHSVDVIVFIVEARHWGREDDYVLRLINNTSTPCILVINKIDKIANKEQLLPILKKLSALYNFTALIPLSAKTGLQVNVFEQQIQGLLPVGPHLFAEDQLTDRPVIFLCHELIREKVFRLCGHELPYVTNVEIESFKESKQLIIIHALILVERKSHKRIIIGDKGCKLKEIASKARLDMARLLGKPVFLQCWCKVKPGWTNDKLTLKQFGYGN